MKTTRALPWPTLRIVMRLSRCSTAAERRIGPDAVQLRVEAAQAARISAKIRMS